MRDVRFTSPKFRLSDFLPGAVPLCRFRLLARRQVLAPWGPWTPFHTQDFEPQGFYNPSIPSKFISEDGRKFWIFVAGDFTASEQPGNFYGLNMLPVTLEVEA